MMTAPSFPKAARWLLCTVLLSPFAFPAVASAAAADLSGSYDWKPVRVGAGGFVTGFVSHPLDPEVRYCRTDVGNAYRWDAASREWVPMIVHEGAGGLPAEIAVAPAKIGVEAIAVDPRDKRVVLLAFPVKYSADSKLPAIAGSVFRSTDGGRSFVKGDLNVVMQPNGGFRTAGECMAINPNDGNVVYFGSRKNGLWKSVNGGANWTQVTGGGAPAETENVVGVRFDRVDDKRLAVYAIAHGGGVFRSLDGGVTWTDVAAGSGLAKPLNSTLDARGNLYVSAGGTTKVWKMTRAGAWSELSPRYGGPGPRTNTVAIDPANPDRLFAINSGGCVSRSLDGGATWTALGGFLRFANTLGWLPQSVNGKVEMWRSNAGVHFDAAGRLWLPQGNEGVLTTVPSTDNTETRDNPLQWTIDSKGIEEFVTHDVIIPPGGGDRAVIALEDGTAFHIDDPDAFTATHANLQGQLISNGTGLAYCPDASSFVAAVTADVHHTGSGKDYSGYSIDGGKTWTPFASRPPGAKAGSIAIGRRDGRGEGNDHIVWYPLGGRPPYWSHDGGKTWTQGEGFKLKENGTFAEMNGFWNGALKQRALVADPLTADRFYLYTPWGGPNRLFRSDDGGKNWSAVADAGVASGGHHAQIAANPYAKDEYWFVDGWEGATTHGLWRSTDGAKFVQISGVDRAITLAVGKGRGATGAVYFYGKLSDDPDWGIFRSEDGGLIWVRVSRYPAGQVDIPTCMAASQDTFGLIYVGLSGNTFVYGKPRR